MSSINSSSNFQTIFFNAVENSQSKTSAPIDKRLLTSVLISEKLIESLTLTKECKEQQKCILSGLKEQLNDFWKIESNEPPEGFCGLGAGSWLNRNDLQHLEKKSTQLMSYIERLPACLEKAMASIILEEFINKNKAEIEKDYKVTSAIEAHLKEPALHPMPKDKYTFQRIKLINGHKDTTSAYGALVHSFADNKEKLKILDLDILADMLKNTMD